MIQARRFFCWSRLGLSMCLQFGRLMMAGMSRTTGPSLSAVCHPLACSHGHLKFPKKSKTELLKPLHVSALLLPQQSKQIQVHDERVEKLTPSLDGKNGKVTLQRCMHPGKGQFCCHFSIYQNLMCRGKGPGFSPTVKGAVEVFQAMK